MQHAAPPSPKSPAPHAAPAHIPRGSLTEPAVQGGSVSACTYAPHTCPACATRLGWVVSPEIRGCVVAIACAWRWLTCAQLETRASTVVIPVAGPRECRVDAEVHYHWKRVFVTCGPAVLCAPDHSQKVIVTRRVRLDAPLLPDQHTRGVAAHILERTVFAHTVLAGAIVHARALGDAVPTGVGHDNPRI